MSTSLLNLDDAPRDPIERLLYLSGVREQVGKELDEAFGSAYFEARLQDRLEAAIAAGPYARKRVLAYSRAENQRRGRTVRWNDGHDPTSTAYYRRRASVRDEHGAF
jgi:hypothetical protein